MGMLLNSTDSKNSDITSIVKGELANLKFQLTIAKDKRVNKITRYHYADCLSTIKEILNPK